MAAEQVQIRRDSNANLILATPTDGEMAYDQTNKYMTIGDGSKAGGHPIPTYKQIQNNTFNAVASSGSADAQTLTLTTHFAPTAYAAYQRFQFIAGFTNTTTCTLNVNALGAKTIKKVTSAAKANLAAGDITSGLLYDVIYDGTDFVLMNVEAGTPVPDSITGSYVEDYGSVPNASQSVTTSPTKVQEFIVGRAGVYNVRIGSTAAADGNHHLQIYKNGAAEGTSRAATTSTRAIWDEDITVAAGDLLQLYASADSGTVDIGPADFAIMSGNPLNSSLHEDWISTLAL